jgi:glycosyltransferase involved in cell wall biosynthesis
VRIAYVVTRGDAVGGASIHVRDIAGAMQARGHEVIVFVGGTGPVTDLLTENRVRFAVVPNLGRAVRLWKDALAYRELRSALKAWRPDLVSTHTAKAGVLGRAAAHSLNLPAIYTPHGWSIGDRIGFVQGRIFTVAERTAAPWSAAIVNVCEYERRLALTREIGRPEQHCVIYNGVHEVGPEYRADPGRLGTVRFVSVARFESPKDHATLLKAVARLRGDWALDLIGDGPELERARALADPNRVRFHGYSANPAPLLAQAQAFVLSTRSEAFPRSILEGMRAGLPIVASNVGGVPEAIPEVLVPAGDVDALRRALQDLMDDPVKRQRLGEDGHHIFECRFRFETTLEQTEALYLSLR